MALEIMFMRIKLYLFFILLFSCAIMYGQRLTLQPGASFTYSFSFHYTKGKETAPPKSDTYRFNVLRRDDSGYYHVRCTLVDYSHSRNTTSEKFIGSDPEDNPFNNTDDLTGGALLQHPFELVVDTNGYLVHINGIKQIVLQDRKSVV